MRKIISCVLLIILFVLANSNLGYSQSENFYDQGTVWSMSFIRTGANASDDYLKGIKDTWEAQMKEGVKEGLIKSYKILLGQAANEEDYNIILMIEFENMASLDPDPTRDKKWDAIEQKIKEKMKDDYEKTVTNYENIRKWLGAKLMREIKFK